MPLLAAFIVGVYVVVPLKVRVTPLLMVVAAFETEPCRVELPETTNVDEALSPLMVLAYIELPGRVRALAAVH